MELAIAECKDELEGNRYVGKQRSSQTFKIIRDTGKLGRIIQEIAKAPAQSKLCDLQMPDEANYAEVIQYANNYLWEIEDHFPKSDAKLWKMMDAHTMEYFRAVKIRDVPHQQKKNAKKKSHRGKPRKSKIRRPGLYAQTRDRRRYKWRNQRDTNRMWGKSE